MGRKKIVAPLDHSYNIVPLYRISFFSEVRSRALLVTVFVEARPSRICPTRRHTRVIRFPLIGCCFFRVEDDRQICLTTQRAQVAWHINVIIENKMVEREGYLRRAVGVSDQTGRTLQMVMGHIRLV